MNEIIGEYIVLNLNNYYKKLDEYVKQKRKLVSDFKSSDNENIKVNF